MLVGGGGHCKSVIDTAKRLDEFSEIVITDESIKSGTTILGCKVVGSDSCLEQLKADGFDFAFITVGSVRLNPIREVLAEKLKSLGFVFPTIVDPSAIIADSANIGEGTFVGKNAVINVGSHIGNHCIVNTGAVIEHDCFVDDYAHISIGTVLCGEVHIGKNCMIGSHSTVLQCLHVGENCVVGAGACVIRNSEDYQTLVGVPARAIKVETHNE